MPLYRRDLGLKRAAARGGFVLRKSSRVPALATLLMPLAIRFSAQRSPQTVASGIVTSATDLITNSITMTPAGGATVGFSDYTDWRGRKAWRGELFSGPTPPIQTVQARISNGYTKTGSGWNNSMIYYFVFAHHRVTSGGPMLNGTDASGVTLSNGPAVGTAANGILRSHSRPATDGRMVPGTNLQVVVVRTTATSVRIWRNGVAETIASAPGAQSATGFFGAVVGGANMGWDIYEFGACLSATGYTDANMNTDGQALMDAFGLVAETATSAAIGDSIVAGFKLVGSGDSLPMKVREYLPVSNRHINYGVSGDTTSLVKARLTNILASYTAAHPCLYELAIGVNDVIGPPSRTAQEIFDQVPFSNGTSTIIDIANTILTAGPQARFMSIVNIACGNGTQYGVIATNTPNLRSLIRGATLLTGTNAQTGGANAGRVFVSDYTNITVGGQTIVATNADATNLTYWQSDGLHPQILTNTIIAPVQAANIAAVLP